MNKIIYFALNYLSKTKLMPVLRSLAALILFCFITVSVSATGRFSSSMPAENHPSLSSIDQRILYMKWFVKLTPEEFGQLRGKKLNFFERMSFRTTQKRMKHQLLSQSTVTSEGVNWGGLALGFFLSIIGVAGAYIFSKDSNFRKWTWIGAGIGLLFFLLFGFRIF